MNLLYALGVVVSTVCVFIFSIHKFSRQVEVLAGDRFKSFLRRVTSTPFRGMLAGTVFTAIIQSSTATTVMLVGLVDAGAISFYNSLGVIFGANVGTVITSQLIVFNVIAVAPVFVLAGFILDKINISYKKYGKMIFYFGLVFLCLYFISIFLEPMKNDPVVLFAFSKISNPYIAAIAGLLVTAIFQSSSIVTGISIVLAGKGIISFDQAFGIILGANIGTTSTALLASSLMNLSAKKAAVAHFMFNLIGVLLFLPFVSRLGVFLKSIINDTDFAVANASLLFNVASAILALIFVKYFYRLVNIIVSHSPKIDMVEV